MAIHYVNCDTCKEEMKVSLFGNSRDREWKAEHYKWMCDDCKIKESLKVQEENKKEGLSPLQGSDKQIAWAETIRRDFIKKTDRLMNRLYDEDDEATELKKTSLKLGIYDDNCTIEQLELDYRVEALFENVKSSFWIDNRDNDLISMLREIPSKEKIYHDNAQVVLEKQVKLEATVRPEEVKTETVAEITIKDTLIEINFPEKNEEFRILVKELGYSWSSRWKRRIYPINGTVEDRVAELGNQLLSHGFTICIIDGDIREKAIKADYTPEHTRWIMRRAKGDYEGWFAISWKRHHEDFYNEARKISGSKWSNPSVIIRPEHFEQVIDFAEQYDFKFSDGAIKAISEAKTQKENILVPKNISEPKTPTTANKEKKFIATEGEIDESLRDKD